MSETTTPGLCPICKIRMCYRKRSIVKKGRDHFGQTVRREKISEWWTCKECTGMSTPRYTALMIKHFNKQNNIAPVKSFLSGKENSNKTDRVSHRYVAVDLKTKKREGIQPNENTFAMILKSAQLSLGYEKVMKCPECGGILVKRTGTYGEFRGCTHFPECKYTENIKNIN